MKSELLKMAVILALMGAIGPFAIDMYLPALPALTADYNAETALGQWTLMSFFIAFGVGQLFYGPASDALGRKGPVYFGLGLFTLASIGCVFAPTIEILIALRFVQGIGAAAVMSIPRAIVRDLYTGNEATRLMSTVMLVISVSPMLAPLLGSALIIPFGWRSVFVAVAIAAAISILVTRFAFTETLPPERRVAFNMRAFAHAFKVLIRDPFFLGVTLIATACFSSFFIFLSTAAFIYTEFYGLTPTQFALAFSVNAAGFFAASQFAPNLGQRIGATATVLWATAGFSVFAFALFSVFALGFGSFAVLAALLFCAFACLGLVIPTSMVLALEYHGPIAGTAASLGGTMQMVLAALGMVVVSLFFDGTPMPLVAAVAICALSALILAFITLRRPLPAAA